MKFFYQSGSMGYGGEGYTWHKILSYDFPKFPIITKTITLMPRLGLPFAVIPLGQSVWNKVSWHNPGFFKWMENYYNPNLILSIGGTDEELQVMCNCLESVEIAGIELNFSCPNVKKKNDMLPKTRHKLYLKVAYNQNMNFWKHQWNKIERIHLNSIPGFFGGLSGKVAQKKNWSFIELWSHLIPVPIAGCSFNNWDDIHKLESLDCRYTGIGSTIITNSKLVNELKEW